MEGTKCKEIPSLKEKQDDKARILEKGGWADCGGGGN